MKAVLKISKGIAAVSLTGEHEQTGILRIALEHHFKKLDVSGECFFGEVEIGFTRDGSEPSYNVPHGRHRNALIHPEKRAQASGGSMAHMAARTHESIEKYMEKWFG
jgi:hypothetical protein